MANRKFTFAIFKTNKKSSVVGEHSVYAKTQQEAEMEFGKYGLNEISGSANDGLAFRLAMVS